MFCTNCGKEIKEGIRFCQYCGNEIVKEDTVKAATAKNGVNGSAEEARTNREKSKQWYVQSVIGIVLVAAIILIIGINLGKGDRTSEVQDGTEAGTLTAQSNDDFVSESSIGEESYEERMQNMYQKYKKIVEDPTKYFEDNYGTTGADYNRYSLIDLTEDKIPEIILYGSAHMISIVSEKNDIALPGDQIVWTEASNIFYTKTTSDGEVTWRKYEVSKNTDGSVSAENIESVSTNKEGYRVVDQGDEGKVMQYFQPTDDGIQTPSVYSVKGQSFGESEFYTFAK